MDEFGCDYECRTVGESIIKYNIPNDWSAEFDAYDNVYPVICVEVDDIRNASAIMDLKLRVVENEDDEYAGCMVLTKQKTIAFKIDYMSDLIRAMAPKNETALCPHFCVLHHRPSCCGARHLPASTAFPHKEIYVLLF